MRIPYVDHIVDGVEKQIKEYGLTDFNSLMGVLTRVSEMIEDLKWDDENSN